MRVTFYWLGSCGISETLLFYHNWVLFHSWDYLVNKPKFFWRVDRTKTDACKGSGPLVAPWSQPDIKANKKESAKNHWSEKERKTPKKHSKGCKNGTIKIELKEILEYPQDKLPVDSEFKGYEQVIVQDISLTTDNILFRKHKYYSASVGKTYLAELPNSYEGEFGSGIKALVISSYYGSNRTQGKLLEFLEDLGISIWAGHLSNLLITNHSNTISLKSCYSI